MQDNKFLTLVIILGFMFQNTSGWKLKPNSPFSEEDAQAYRRRRPLYRNEHSGENGHTSLLLPAIEINLGKWSKDDYPKKEPLVVNMNNVDELFQFIEDVQDDARNMFARIFKNNGIPLIVTLSNWAGINDLVREVDNQQRRKGSYRILGQLGNIGENLLNGMLLNVKTAVDDAGDIVAQGLDEGEKILFDDPEGHQPAGVLIDSINQLPHLIRQNGLVRVPKMPTLFRSSSDSEETEHFHFPSLEDFGNAVEDLFNKAKDAILN